MNKMLCVIIFTNGQEREIMCLTNCFTFMFYMEILNFFLLTKLSLIIAILEPQN